MAKPYSKQFKAEAVALLGQPGMTIAKAARDLGVAQSQLYKWRKSSGVHGASAFPGKGNLLQQVSEEQRMSAFSTTVDKIVELRKTCTPVEVDKLGKILKIAPRTIALALVQKSDGRILVDCGYDSKKEQKFYRLLGGGVDFAEPGVNAVVREIKEETGVNAVAHDRVGVFENIFTFEGASFHEIVFVYRVSFAEQKDYERDELLVSDSYRAATTAVWKNLEEIKSEGAKLYPEGLEEVLLATFGR